MFVNYVIRPIVTDDRNRSSVFDSMHEAENFLEENEGAIIEFALYGIEDSGEYKGLELHIADRILKADMLELVKRLFGISLQWKNGDRIDFTNPLSAALDTAEGSSLRGGFVDEEILPGQEHYFDSAEVDAISAMHEPCNGRDASYWSVFAHAIAGGRGCIGDFASPVDAFIYALQVEKRCGWFTNESSVSAYLTRIMNKDRGFIPIESTLKMA